MKYRSTLMADLRGSMAGLTASRNKGGAYLRARVKPTNPNSEAQQEVRQAFALAVQGWVALTAAQRAAWNAYAVATPITDSMGETIQNSGRAWYIAQASFRTRIALVPAAAAPVTPGMVSLGEPTNALTLSAATGLTGAFGNAAPQSAAGAGDIIALMGPPISAGVLDYHGPYTFFATNPGIEFDETAGTVGRYGIPITTQRRPFKFRFTDDNGKISNEFTTIITIQA